MSAAGGAILAMCCGGTLDMEIMEEGDRQVKSVYESVITSG